METQHEIKKCCEKICLSVFISHYQYFPHLSVSLLRLHIPSYLLQVNQKMIEFKEKDKFAAFEDWLRENNAEFSQVCCITTMNE